MLSSNPWKSYGSITNRKGTIFSHSYTPCSVRSSVRMLGTPSFHFAFAHLDASIFHTIDNKFHQHRVRNLTIVQTSQLAELFIFVLIINPLSRKGEQQYGLAILRLLRDQQTS